MGIFRAMRENKALREDNRDILQQDVNALKQGKLGLSDGQMTQVRDQAMDSARQGVQAVNAQMARGNQDPSQIAEMRKMGTQAIGQAGAQGGLEANRISTALAESRRAEILARLGQQVDRSRENAMFAANLGMQAVGMGANVASGGLAKPVG